MKHARAAQRRRACAWGAVLVLAACSDRNKPPKNASASQATVTSPAADGGGPDAGQADASPAAVSCRIPDDFPVGLDDADGGENCRDVPRVIIANNCTGTICHYSGSDRKAGLDLMSPCVADRLLGVRSTCQGKLLIDPEHPSQSFILDKLQSVKPACGESMPWTGHLPHDQLACMVAWLNAVIRAAHE